MQEFQIGLQIGLRTAWKVCDYETLLKTVKLSGTQRKVFFTYSKKLVWCLYLVFKGSQTTLSRMY